MNHPTSIHDDALLNALPFSIAVLNEVGEIVKINSSWDKFMTENEGISGKCGLRANYLQASREDSVSYQALSNVLNGTEESMSWEYDCHSTKEHRWFLAVASCLRDDTAKVVGAVITHIDISERKQTELFLKQMTIMDPLVKIPNRRHLINYGRKLLRQADDEDFIVGGMFVDLDNLKKVNDLHGHHAGDELIKIVGQRIHHTIREVDLVCRYGGDEFFALLPDINSMQGLQDVADRLLAHIQEPIDLDSESLEVTVSIGAGLRHPYGGTISEFIRACDANMYRAKRDGKARFYM